MNWIDRVLAGRIEKAIADRVKQSVGDELYAEILRAVGKFNPVYMGDNIDDYIKQGYMYNPLVYSLVSFIGQKASTIPWFVYNIKDKEALKCYKSGSPEMTLQKWQLRRKALEPIVDHELAVLFNTPNPLQGWSEFIEQAVGFKLVTGNTYIHAIGPSNGVNGGKVQELWVLPSQAIEIIAGDKSNPIKEYRYRGNKQVTIPANEVIHLKYWTPEYLAGAMLYGMSPIRAARRVISKSNASYDAGTATLQHSGMMGFISANRSAIDAGLTDEQAVRIQERLEKYQNPKNRGKAIVTSADLKWQQMGMSPVDLNIIESDKMDLRTLCNIYHVPSELFNDAANKTYSNTKEAARAMWVNAVIPALTQFRDSFNNFISSRYGEVFIDYDTSVVPELQDDLETQINALEKAWFLTPNQKLEVLQFETDPMPEMDMHWIPSGLVPMEGWQEQKDAENEAAAAQLEASTNKPTDEEVNKHLKELGIDDYAE